MTGPIDPRRTGGPNAAIPGARGSVPDARGFLYAPVPPNATQPGDTGRTSSPIQRSLTWLVAALGLSDQTIPRELYTGDVRPTAETLQGGWYDVQLQVSTFAIVSAGATAHLPIFAADPGGLQRLIFAMHVFSSVNATIDLEIEPSSTPAQAVTMGPDCVITGAAPTPAPWSQVSGKPWGAIVVPPTFGFGIQHTVGAATTFTGKIVSALVAAGFQLTGRT